MAILHPDKSEFDALVKEEGVLFVDFFADWCGPCKMLAPEMEKLAAEFEGKAKVVKINVDQHQDLAAEFRVQSIPALYVIKNGKIVSQDLGYKPYPALQSMLYRAI
ncbi:MAG: thioredoxin [Erysipelotrichaceae bacterium]|nr:thioredoxin [Erysipelotrichaceae bacterium]